MRVPDVYYYINDILYMYIYIAAAALSFSGIETRLFFLFLHSEQIGQECIM